MGDMTFYTLVESKWNHWVWILHFAESIFYGVPGVLIRFLLLCRKLTHTNTVVARIVFTDINYMYIHDWLSCESQLVTIYTLGQCLWHTSYKCACHVYICTELQCTSVSQVLTFVGGIMNICKSMLISYQSTCTVVYLLSWTWASVNVIYSTRQFLQCVLSLFSAR